MTPSLKKGLRYGCFLGLGLAGLLLVGTTISLIIGSSGEIWEIVGLVGLLVGFPTSLLTEFLSGPVAVIALLGAIVLNWTLIGAAVGALMPALRGPSD